MTEIIYFIFNNIFLFVLIGLAYYVYHEYKDLKKRSDDIKEIFDKTLTKYLDEKIKAVNDTITEIINEYGKENSEVNAEINRLLLTIEKWDSGSINDKVETSNAINKFKLNKKIDLNKYPHLKDLEQLSTFTDEDMESKENGLAIARKEYNTQAFRYNERASSFLMQYLTKFLKLNQQFEIFDAPKTSSYEENYEVFEEKEPEINSLSSLNQPMSQEEALNKLIYKNDYEETNIKEEDLPQKK